MSFPENETPVTAVEPLLPIEKKLIAWSLILGVVLLAILVWTGNSSLPIGR